MTAEEYVLLARYALTSAGFKRQVLDGTVYFSAGTGPTLVLIHGVNDQAGTWATVAPALARTHRVIVPDLPGHGESEPKEGTLPLSMMVERLDALLADESDLTLVGNSLGGWLSILYTLKRPEKIARLILEAGGGLARPFATPPTANTRDAAVTLLRAVHGPNFVPPDWTIDAVIARAMSSPMLRVTEALQWFVDTRLNEIRVPTTLVWGADDGVLPLDYAEALQRGIAGAKLHVIDGAAHIPHLQQPERFLACLTR